MDIFQWYKQLQRKDQMATAKKKPPVRRATEPLYIAVTTCGDYNYRGPFKKSEMNREIQRLLEGCCNEDDCVTVYEIVGKGYSIERDEVKLVPLK